jgi:hypothetical protein
MKQKVLFNIIFLFLLVLLNSCGVVFTKYRNTVYINSEPQGAEVIFKDSVVGITPASITFDRLENIDSIGVHLKKENYVMDKLILNTDLHYPQLYVDLFPFLWPYVISESYKGYIGFSQKDYDIKLRNIDSLNRNNLDINPIKINPLRDKINFSTDFRNIQGTYQSNSEFYLELLPLVSFNGGIISFNLNHHIDIYNLHKTNDDRIDLGLRSGWGYHYKSFGFANEYDRSRGYYILPSISYEIVTSYGMSNKYIFSIGPSYINNEKIDAKFNYDTQISNYNYQHEKGLALSFNAQYIRKDYVDNTIYGFSLGNLNKSQYFQFLFGFFVF